MIITRLVGGLGNQMFEYAAARWLALKHKTELKIDIHNYKTDSFRRYGLSCFNIEATVASPAEILKLFPMEGLLQLAGEYVGSRGESILRSLYYRTGFHRNLVGRYYSYDPREPDHSPLLQGRVIAQRHFHYDPDFVRCPDNVYITGYWISEKYFSGIENVIRNDFSFKMPISGRNQEIAEIIQGCNSVSVHIRRTDKVSDPLYEETDLQYCTKAIRYMNKHLDDPHYFIFSDDINWVKTNLRYSGAITFVDINDDHHNYEDLRLMSLCKHNIIAESSFSWWGAWLNSNQEKVVISPNPHRWINLENFIVDDVLPSTWIILD